MIKERADSVPRELRKLAALAAGAVVTLSLLAGCTGSGDDARADGSGGAGGSASAKGDDGHGPLFQECGGVSDETITDQTRVAGLVNTAKTSAGCQWLVRGGIAGPHFSFSWYRGSPIGRERKTEEVSRASVEDITIDGHSGFIAVGNVPTLGDNLCEVAIQFNNDFIEWSVNFTQKPFPDPCAVAKELTRQSIANSK